MLEGKWSIKDSDMPIEMQLQAMFFASEALYLYDVVDYRNIAAHIKKVSVFYHCAYHFSVFISRWSRL